MTSESQSNHRQDANQNGVQWPYYICMLLALWLISNPLTFAYRRDAMFWSDIASGVLVLLFSWLALSPQRRSWAAWCNAGVGMWLQFAPILFWAESPAGYVTDSLLGVLILAFSILMPGTPGMKDIEGPDKPLGWSYNPSSWDQRAPILTFAFLCFLISRYMGAYQLGYIQTVWDPFFGDGTRKVLESDISKAFPVSDAALGSFSYMFETISGLVGSTRRWRTMPWMVILFSLQIVPLGIVSIVLVIMQPVAVGAWCTLCLLTAVLMLIMIPPAVDEMVATGQYLYRSHRAGKSLWKTFWQGGGEVEETEADREADKAKKEKSFGSVLGVPLSLIVLALIGVWVMAAPAVLGIEGRAADNYHIVGVLITTFSVTAIAEVARSARFLNILFALWLMASAFILEGGNSLSMWNSLAVGVVVILLSLPKGGVQQRYGLWHRYIV